MDHLKHCVPKWRAKLADGSLTDDDLKKALDAGRRQQLLYLQTQSTALDSEVLGMSLVEDGHIRDEPDDPEQWPYQSVLEAIKDGWRVIKFPEMALLLQEDKTFGLGCEFILEK